MRTKGSYSLVKVTLQQLTAKLRPDATVPVHRKFAAQLGIDGELIPCTKMALSQLGNPIAEEQNDENCVGVSVTEQ